MTKEVRAVRIGKKVYVFNWDAEKEKQIIGWLKVFGAVVIYLIVYSNT